jgi:hypothetical protein
VSVLAEFSAVGIDSAGPGSLAEIYRLQP